MDEGKIFLVYEGIYEDWEAIGFTYTEKDAVNICLNHNKNVVSQNFVWDYREANAIESPNDTVQFVFVYSFHIEKIPSIKKFVLANERVDFYEEGKYEFTKEPKIKESEFNSNCTIMIPTKEKNRDAAIEKAQNLLKEYNGENFIIR